MQTEGREQEEQRATKKVKNRERIVDDPENSQTTDSMQTEDETQDNVNATKERPNSSTMTTYAEMAARGSSMNKNPPVMMPEEEIVYQEGDVAMDLSGDYPKISFSNRIHELIDINMKQVIITRLLGKKIGYKALVYRIHALWRPLGNFNLIDLDNDYFLVKFENLKDYTRVLTEGPWMTYGSYLTVQHWSRNFPTTEKHNSHVIAWVRLPGLPYRYYNNVLIRTIANIIGKVIKIDYNTKVGERGKFARIAIVIDLNKPFILCVGIDDFIQNIEYEGLQQICFKCGTYEHAKESCQINQEDKQMKTSNTDNGIEEQSNTESSKDNPLGPWMVVQPRGRFNRNQRSQFKNKEAEEISNKGSRFTPLCEELLEEGTSDKNKGKYLINMEADIQNMLLK
ncbi:uncharacterized protein LOC120199667 [Hibiscus syriacus]|uniref:uncharacterized protein LOC120199667 n=1 Tax=Hibiscus syriacus TaxID=106335 RepID=UPI0019247A43|nr:uncharacterized protein LOC120199667 [Hibiscus syriacus]